MTTIKTTRINNFVCPACGEVIRQVVAKDGVVKGWCHSAKKEICVTVSPAQEEEAKVVKDIAKVVKEAAEISYLDTLKQKREKVLKEVVSAREDGDLKENSAYHAAREQLSILDDKILHEEDRLKKLNQDK
jgi:hypothetical protein